LNLNSYSFISLYYTIPHTYHLPTYLSTYQHT